MNKEEFLRKWGVSGMPADKIRLANAAWDDCAKIKDAEIERLKQYLFTSEQNNSGLVTEIEQLKAQVEKMREATSALIYGSINFNPIDNGLKALESTPQSSLADHDREVEIKVLGNAINTIDDEFGILANWRDIEPRIQNMIKERENKY
jgi:hypothetical protein